MVKQAAAQQTEPAKRNPRSIAQTNKRRGAMVERVVADYLAAHTGLPVERRRLEGVLDRGDLAGIPDVVVEIKSGQPHLKAWLRETERERVNAGAAIGILWWAPPGLAKNPDRHVVMVRPTTATHRLCGDTRCAALLVPPSMIGWHTSQGARYHLHPYDTYAVSGLVAATTWNWAR